MPRPVLMTPIHASGDVSGGFPHGPSLRGLRLTPSAPVIAYPTDKGRGVVFLAREAVRELAGSQEIPVGSLVSVITDTDIVIFQRTGPDGWETTNLPDAWRSMDFSTWPEGTV